LCWTSQARPHAAALFRNVEPSTEKGRGELSSVTTGGGPPRSPAARQTDASLLLAVEVEDIDEVVAVVDVIIVVAVALCVCCL
jgi:hypothetical protein